MIRVRSGQVLLEKIGKYKLLRKNRKTLKFGQENQKLFKKPKNISQFSDQENHKFSQENRLQL